MTLKAVLAIAMLVAPVISSSPSVAGGSPSQAQKQHARQETQPYEPGRGDAGFDQPGVIVTSVTFTPGPENLVRLTIGDQTGAPVLAKVVQDTTVGVFCGATRESLRIRPNFPVTVQLREGLCLNGEPSVVTSGQVQAEFFRRRLPRAFTEIREYAVFGTATFGFDDEPHLSLRVADVEVPAAARSRVEVSITDSSGTLVAAKVEQEGARSPLFCGETDGPLSIRPNIPFRVLLYSGSCENQSSLVTLGSVEIRFLP